MQKRGGVVLPALPVNAKQGLGRRGEGAGDCGSAQPHSLVKETSAPSPLLPQSTPLPIRGRARGGEGRAADPRGQVQRTKNFRKSARKAEHRQRRKGRNTHGGNEEYAVVGHTGGSRAGGRGIFKGLWERGREAPLSFSPLPRVDSGAEGHTAYGAAGFSTRRAEQWGSQHRPASLPAAGMK